MNESKAAIFFVSVKDNSIKQQSLCTLVHKHFERGERILIATPSAEAASFVDQLLWRWPDDSFIPHTIVDSSTSKEPIVITTSRENVNQAHILINLCSEICENRGSFRRIYELLDLTHPLKEQNSQKRKSGYQSFGFIPKVISPQEIPSLP